MEGTGSAPGRQKQIYRPYNSSALSVFLTPASQGAETLPSQRMTEHLLQRHGPRCPGGIEEMVMLHFSWHHAGPELRLGFRGTSLSAPD